jgi:hypothetical protein
MTKALALGNGLTERLATCNPTQRTYILAILRGYSVTEAYDIAKCIGDVDRYLVEPTFNELLQYFMDNGYSNKEHIEREWKNILSAHYVEMAIIQGIKELGKEKKDTNILKVATACALATRNKVSLEDKASSYDEMILKRHIERE